MTPKEEHVVDNCEEDQQSQLPPTDMLYMTYEGNWLTECQATVLATKKEEQQQQEDNGVETNPADKVYITLDRSVMHAQGGGQPTDKGVLKVGEDKVMQVEKVTIDRSTGIATHAGKLLSGSGGEPYCLEVGQQVQVQIDQELRQILSECHTAGKFGLEDARSMVV